MVLKVLPAAMLIAAVSAPPACAETSLANRASMLCAKTGGNVEMETDARGTRGICVFPDGTRIDEWVYFRSRTRTRR